MKPYVNQYDAYTLDGQNKDWIVRLEYVGTNYDNESGRSSKFWSAENEGGSVRIRWGKIGSSGQSTLKDWSYFDKKCGDKLSKGYALAPCTAVIPADKPATLTLTGPYAQIVAVIQDGAKYNAFNSDGDFVMTLTEAGYNEISAVLEQA